MDLREIGYEGVDWVEMFYDRVQWQGLVNVITNLLFPERRGIS
jgi:hypothetical protein